MADEEDQIAAHIRRVEDRRARIAALENLIRHLEQKPAAPADDVAANLSAIIARLAQVLSCTVAGAAVHPPRDITPLLFQLRVMNSGRETEALIAEVERRFTETP